MREILDKQNIEKAVENTINSTYITDIHTFVF